MGSSFDTLSLDPWKKYLEKRSSDGGLRAAQAMIEGAKELAALHDSGTLHPGIASRRCSKCGGLIMNLLDFSEHEMAHQILERLLPKDDEKGGGT